MHGCRGFLSGWPVLIAVLAVAGGPAARAQLQAEPAGVNLGRHQQEEVASAVVKLTNTGPGKLEIIGTQADCSCTAATPEKNSLMPGESTSLEIKMETRSYEGLIRRRLVVQTSAGELHIPVEITIGAYEHWTMTPAFVVLPPSQRGREAAGQVVLTYSGPGKLELGRFSAVPPYIEATVAGTDGKIFKVTLKKRSEAPAGNHAVKVSVETNDPVDPRLTLKVFVPVSSALRISPNPVVLPTVKVGQGATREVSLRGWTEGLVPRFELPQGEARVREQSGDTVQLEVTVTPQRPGPSTQLLRIYAGETLEAEIPVIVRAEPADPAK